MNLTTVLDFLNGKKTYIVAIVAAATAIAEALGYTVPDWVYAMEGALGIGALRVAITKS
jgi:hypothetical protein